MIIKRALQLFSILFFSVLVKDAFAEPITLSAALTAAAPWIGTAVLGGGGIWAASKKNKKGLLGSDEPETQKTVQEPKFYAQPEYTEATKAREAWWNNLTQAGGSGTWGVSLPDYDKIYQNAAKRINQYYWGGASGQPGLMDKIAAGAARRGMADQPALGVLKQRTGAEEAGKLADVSVGLDVTKANAIEQARQTWLNSIMNLSQLFPKGTWGGTTTSTGQPRQEGALPAILGGGLSLIGNQMLNNQIMGARNSQNKQNQDFMSSLFGATPSSITSIMGGGNAGGAISATDFFNMAELFT